MTIYDHGTYGRRLSEFTRLGRMSLWHSPVVACTLPAVGQPSKGDQPAAVQTVTVSAGGRGATIVRGVQHEYGSCRNGTGYLMTGDLEGCWWAAIQAADTLLLTVPNQLGVEDNTHAIESILKYVAPGLG